MITKRAVGSARGITLAHLTAHLQPAVDEQEIPATIDVQALARFMQTMQGGMSIKVRDGAECVDLNTHSV